MAHQLWFASLFLAVLTSNAAKIPDPRIVNGEVATKGQFPWQVGVVSIDNILEGTILSYCGGAIISEEWILTAARCVDDAVVSIIMYDTLNLDSTDSKVQASNNFVVHEGFDPENLKNDIALVQLSTPLTFDENVSAIALAEEELQANTTVTVAGWGQTRDIDIDHKYDILRFINVTTIDNEECTVVYGDAVITDAVVCTNPGRPVRNPCFGDDGDPVIADGDDGPIHVAIFSFLSLFGCDNGNFPVGYTRTAYYRDWIRNVTGV